MDGLSIGRIIRDVGIPQRTLWKWRHEDLVFQAELRRQQAYVLSAHRGRLKMASERAVEVLEEIALSHNEAGSSRVAAAGKILDIVHRQVELQTMDERMAEIERALAEAKGERAAE
jgi:hypothetical protein